MQHTTTTGLPWYQIQDLSSGCIPPEGKGLCFDSTNIIQQRSWSLSHVPKGIINIVTISCIPKVSESDPGVCQHVISLGSSKQPA
jgi:hypothetical protein